MTCSRIPSNYGIRAIRGSPRTGLSGVGGINHGLDPNPEPLKPETLFSRVHRSLSPLPSPLSPLPSPLSPLPSPLSPLPSPLSPLAQTMLDRPAEVAAICRRCSHPAAATSGCWLFGFELDERPVGTNSEVGLLFPVHARFEFVRRRRFSP